MSKIVTIIPIVSGNGGKYITTNLGHYFKELNPNSKVAIVDFDVRNPYLAESLNNDEIHGIDNLIDKIDGNLLNEKLFAENMVVLKNGVHLFKGTKLVNQYKIFNKKHATTIIEFLRKMYDISFISTVAETDNALSIYAIHEADEILLVGRNNYSNLKAIDRVLKIINNYKKTDIVRIIYNMYTTNSKASLTEIVKNNNITGIGFVEYEEDTIDNQNLINTGLKIFKSKNKFDDNFKEIVKNHFIKG